MRHALSEIGAVDVKMSTELAALTESAEGVSVCALLGAPTLCVVNAVVSGEKRKAGVG
jgi:hypothetical protein